MKLGYYGQMKDDRHQIDVNINEDLCKGCGYCIEACPKKILEFATYFNPSGFHPVSVIDKSKCTGCGLCYQVCPEVAIEVAREK